ncbi:pre-mRNA-splicing factor ISY1 homolog [Eurytemora carolleeae]|uniref:pre-mRNA-splicing factor ISY1 homolog n=1 Tax=Eurytemora carolleeae TaxID=1294199 RepID=UPI000C7878D2|nr:pre-mRNA-splicing factor ISY1 homolog [Eurytemora carolleeae]|eukprot:XP_023331985.1 pre-mRNA-splicing factor ISY1 homolog [Eurytemora affinis]
MARNSEKAMTALARWRRGKEEEEGIISKKNEKRPYLATECDNLGEAERWRGQVIREISKNVTAIQNAGLGEFRIRDLNDHINKLLREKMHWETRIRELGGKSYSSKGARMLDREGKEVPGNRGYKYFGAARDLPGVRELFDTDVAPSGKKTRAELMKDVDAQYYGFRDDDDGLLVPMEVVAEKNAINAAIQEYKEKKGMAEDDDDVDIYLKDDKGEDEALQEAMEAGKEGRFMAHVPIPTQRDIEEALLRRKKQELLELLAIDDTLEDIEKESGVEKKEIKPEDVPEIKEIVKPAHVVLPDLDTEMGEVKPPGDE